MGRPSRCPGCKQLKSTHAFGHPGKYCSGPVDHEAEQDLEGIDELEHSDKGGATASPHIDVLQSLAESVQLLSTEMKLTSCA